jgi:hypothetical protein
MKPKWLLLLSILAALLLAGCTLKAEDDDGDGGEVSVDDEDDNDNDAPGAGLLVMLGSLGTAVLMRRKDA